MNMRFAPPQLRKRNRLVGALTLVAVILFAPMKARGQTQEYIVRQLSSNDALGVPCKLNSAGDITGSGGSMPKGEIRAAVWNRSNGRSKHLASLLGADYSSGFDINDAGEIAGASNSGNALVPIMWTARGSLNRIPLFSGDRCGQAAAINKYGHVVGYSSGSDGEKAFLWMRNTGVRNLGMLPGGKYSAARDLNDSDEVAGVSDSPLGERAVLWTKGGNVRDLGTLPGDFASEAVAINNAGDVVGYSRGPNRTRGFLWTKGGGMEDLGILPGDNSSRGFDINDSGTVVGTSSSSSGDHAFIWNKQTGMVDLNDVVPMSALSAMLVEAHAINSKGEVLAMGVPNHSQMESHDEMCAPAPPLSFLLTPVASQ